MEYFKKTWNGFTKNQKIGICVVAALVLIVSIILIVVFTPTSDEVTTKKVETDTDYYITLIPCQGTNANKELKLYAWPVVWNNVPEVVTRFMTNKPDGVSSWSNKWKLTGKGNIQTTVGGVEYVIDKRVAAWNKTNPFLTKNKNDGIILASANLGENVKGSYSINSVISAKDSGSGTWDLAKTAEATKCGTKTAQMRFTEI